MSELHEILSRKRMREEERKGGREESREAMSSYSDIFKMNLSVFFVERVISIYQLRKTLNKSFECNKHYLLEKSSRTSINI